MSKNTKPNFVVFDPVKIKEGSAKRFYSFSCQTYGSNFTQPLIIYFWREVVGPSRRVESGW